MSCLDEIFASLESRLAELKTDPRRDNEATRHDQLVYPVLTHPAILGWYPADILSQSSIRVPEEVQESHIFRGAQLRNRRPDLVISPVQLERAVGVVEEKGAQPCVEALNSYRLQLHEYQALYECVWGLLTDGEHWIVKQNFETVGMFSSLRELRDGVPDLRFWVGRESLLRRLNQHGTTTLVLLKPTVMPFTQTGTQGAQAPKRIDGRAKMKQKIRTYRLVTGKAPGWSEEDKDCLIRWIQGQAGRFGYAELRSEDSSLMEFELVMNALGPHRIARAIQSNHPEVEFSLRRVR
jgi:hypothetical protein